MCGMRLCPRVKCRVVPKMWRNTVRSTRLPELCENFRRGESTEERIGDRLPGDWHNQLFDVWLWRYRRCSRHRACHHRPLQGEPESLAVWWQRDGDRRFGLE